MICPNCGHDQDDRWLTCHNCHAVFSTMGIAAPQVISPALYSPVQPPPAAASTLQSKSRVLDVLIFLLLIADVILALVWVNVPKGKPVLDGAYRNEDKGFALNLPLEWQFESPIQTQQRLEKRHITVSPPTGSTDPRLVIYADFINYLDDLGFPPCITVAVVYRSQLRLDETGVRSLLESMLSLQGSFFEGYRLNSLEVIKVDRLQAVCIAYTGTVTIHTAASKNRSDSLESQNIILPLKAQLALIPGRNCAYLVNFMASSRQSDVLEAEFAWCLKTFRVLQRPERIISGLHELFELCLIVLLFYSLNALRKIIFPRSRW